MMSERFDWEDIDEYDRLTGIEPIDKALVYTDPTGPLKQHLSRREREAGRDAIVADLTALIDATAGGSFAHGASEAWLQRYKAGVTIGDL